MKKISLVLILILVLISLLGCKKAICGNGITEKGETYRTCCEDTGCLGEQTCQNNKCIEPECGECEYLENHQCLKYRCCGDGDCIGGQRCVNHGCVEPTCGECQYLEGHQCIDYTCCKDIDCNDNNPNTEDICVNPGTNKAKCEYEVKGCSDGTLYNQCSINEPKYCTDKGGLIDNCIICGCPNTQRCVETDDYEPIIMTGECTDVECFHDNDCIISTDIQGVIHIELGVCVNAGTSESYCEY